MPPKKIDDSPVFQLKVTLKGIRPPIWRRILVRGSTTLYRFHDIVQVVMGWEDEHLHEFVVGDTHYGVPDPDWGLDVKNEARVKLGQIVAQPKDRILYEYDFGDGWLHEILVEKVLPAEPDVHYPVCVKGKRACPPEDVGGEWGYATFLEAIADPENPEYDDMVEWGGEFDPEEFDLEAINAGLKRL